MRDPNKNVTFVFKCYEKESVDLKIRLRYDGLQQGQFFRALLLLYIEQDPLMLQIVERIKEDQKTMGKKKRNKALADSNAGRDLLRNLGLTDQDKESLFDLIESFSEQEDE